MSDIGTRVFNIRATDDEGAYDEETFQITVDPVPKNAPVISSVPDQLIDEDTPFNYQVVASDQLPLTTPMMLRLHQIPQATLDEDTFLAINSFYGSYSIDQIGYRCRPVA